MQTSETFIKSLTAILLLALLLALGTGCAPTPVIEGEQLQQRLAQAEKDQDPEGMACALLGASKQTQGRQRAELQMQAMEVLIDASLFEKLPEYAQQVDTQTFWPDVAPYRAQLIRAATAFANGETTQPLQDARNLPLPQESAVEKRRLIILAAIYEHRGDWVDAARQYSLLADKLDDGTPAAEKNQAAIWNALSKATNPEIQNRLTQTRDGIFAGWLELSLLFPNRQSQIPAWSQGNPNHPAVRSGFLQLLRDDRFRTEISPMDETAPIAVLLPRDERYKTAVLAIYEGIRFAHAANAKTRDRELLLLDSGTDTEQFLGALNAAIDRGASLIIGPLLREQIPAIEEFNRARPPILALNQPPEDAFLPQGVISFALSPEQDARATAERMLLDGHQRAVVFHANDRNGKRGRDAFVHEYTLLGGTVVGQSAFEPNQTDFSQQLRRLLDVRSPNDGPFIPEIRSDIDAIFISANARQLNLIVPQLDFFGADQLSRFSLGLTWAGRNNPEQDMDKNGTIIPTEPMLLSETRGPDDPMRQAYEQALITTKQPRLFAFGADALTAGTQLTALADNQVIDGLTGRLTLSVNGVIERTPVFGQFIAGRVKPAIDPRTGRLPSTVIDYNQRARDRQVAEQKVRGALYGQDPMLPAHASPVSNLSTP